MRELLDKDTGICQIYPTTKLRQAKLGRLTNSNYEFQSVENFKKEDLRVELLNQNSLDSCVGVIANHFHKIDTSRLTYVKVNQFAPVKLFF